MYFYFILGVNTSITYYGPRRLLYWSQTTSETSIKASYLWSEMKIIKNILYFTLGVYTYTTYYDPCIMLLY